MAIYRGQPIASDPPLYTGYRVNPYAQATPSLPLGPGGSSVYPSGAPTPPPLVNAPLPPSRADIMGPRPANAPATAPGSPPTGPMSWLQALFGGGQQTPQGMSAFLNRPMGGQDMAGRY